jgi:histidinol-phosphatase
VDSAWRNRYEVAVAAAQRAGQLALRYFDADVAVELKPDRSPVTLADREGEALLRSILLAKFPGDGFLGEESGDASGTSGFRWIVDPIDGTRSFVRGIPIWAILIGLEYKDEQIAGIAHLPAMGMTYRALRGDGAYRDHRRLWVSEIHDLSEAQIFYSSISWFEKAGQGEAFLNLVAQTQRQRGFGDFYGFVLVAQGSGEAMIDHGVDPWDVAGMKPLVEEAGGRFTDWDGNPTIHRPDVVATNGYLHDKVLQQLRKPSAG